MNHSIDLRVAIITLAGIGTAFIQTGFKVRKIDRISVSLLLM